MGMWKSLGCFCKLEQTLTGSGSTAPVNYLQAVTVYKGHERVGLLLEFGANKTAWCKSDLLTPLQALRLCI